MTTQPPAFQFYAQDFLTGVMYLTNEEIGIYIKLLAKQWTDGKIPKKRLGFLAGIEWDNFSDELKSKFTDFGEYVINEDLENKRHWNWKGGITPHNQKIRQSIKYREWRIKVFQRDGYTCQHCGSKGKLEAHHIKEFSKYPELRIKVSNGLTLCKKCHINHHRNERNKKKPS
jgi:hypothetical protein